MAGGLITRAVERVDSGYRRWHVGAVVARHGRHLRVRIHPSLKDRYLSGMAKGELVGAFGLTEPNHGNDPAQWRRRREHPQKKGYYLLSGSKTWITNSPHRRRPPGLGQAEGDRQDSRLRHRRSATVPTGTLETPAIKNKTGLRASITGMIHLQDCPVPQENMFPDVEGLRGPFSCLNNARYGIALGTMGALEE